MSDDTGMTGRIFVFIEMDLSTTSTISLVVVIIGHSTDFSSTDCQNYRRLRQLVNLRDFQRDRKIDCWSS